MRAIVAALLLVVACDDGPMHTVTIAGEVDGAHATSSPSGIDCGPTCSHEFSDGTDLHIHIDLRVGACQSLTCALPGGTVSAPCNYDVTLESDLVIAVSCHGAPVRE